MISNRIVSDAAIEDVLLRLSQLDDEEAQANAAAEFADNKLKQIYSERFLNAEGNNAVREAKARVSPEYKQFLVEHAALSAKARRLKNERQRLTMVYEVWRSESANIRGRT